MTYTAKGMLHKTSGGSAQESKGRSYICFVLNVDVQRLLNLNDYILLWRKKSCGFSSEGVAFIYCYLNGTLGRHGE